MKEPNRQYHEIAYMAKKTIEEVLGGEGEGKYGEGLADHHYGVDARHAKTHISDAMNNTNAPDREEHFRHALVRTAIMYYRWKNSEDISE